jgi:hypothetical protein
MRIEENRKRAGRQRVEDVERDLRGRLGRVQQAMAERGFGGLLVYYGAQHNMLRMDQLRYLTDFKAMGASILLVPQQGEPSLVLTPSWDLARAREAVPYTSVIAVDPSELFPTAAISSRRSARPARRSSSSGSSVRPKSLTRVSESCATWRASACANTSSPPRSNP